MQPQKYHPTVSLLALLYIIKAIVVHFWGVKNFPGSKVVRNLPANAGDTGDEGSRRVGKIPWRKKWQPTPAFLPGKFHGQWSSEGCSPWGRKVLGNLVTEHAHFRDERLRSANQYAL